MSIKIVSSFPSKDYSINVSDNKRDWMTDTYVSHAYRCFPLLTANSHGWTVNLSEECVVDWDGGDRPENLKVISGCGESNVAGGYVTFRFPYIFITDTDHYLWCSGQPNYIREDMSPLNAIIRSDWYPTTFHFTWKLHKTGRTVFPKDMPIMFFMPYPKELIDSTDIEIYNGEYDKDFQKEKDSYEAYILKSEKENRLSENQWKERIGLYKQGKISENSSPKVNDSSWTPKPKNPKIFKNMKEE